jgi:hypothetical protein
MTRYHYTILPMVLKSDEETANPTEYIEMMNVLGSSGYRLALIHNDCMIFIKECLDSEK